MYSNFLSLICTGVLGASLVALALPSPHRHAGAVESAANEQGSSTPRLGFAEAEGTRIAYQVYGDLKSGKTPLVMLHGSLMSAESMAPLIAPFTPSRPVIAIDARGHGRTGDVPGAITYERMADDAAGVLRSLGVRRADVFGYSMGATTALVMAVRHPDLVDKQVIMSGVSERGGWFPASQKSFEQWNAKMFAGSPVEASWKKQSVTPNAFASVIDKLRQTETANYDLTPQQVRGIPGKTMIVAGDHDGVQLSHAVTLFGLRGGNSEKVAMQGFLSQTPRTRLAVIPGMSHTGMLGEGKLLAELVVPFLDDQKPAPLVGFFEGMDMPAEKAQ
jgi:pimeloyl-ACP methyl ester carboxylesterase